MIFDPQIHRRRSIRLQGYDYVQAGAYFVTLCVRGRECLFGAVIDGEMRLNEYGNIVYDEWMRTGVVRRDVVLDAFVVMPNHVHGIIVLVEVTDDVGATRRVAPTGEKTHISQNNPMSSRPNGLVSGSIGAIVGQFKSIVTKHINCLRGTHGVAIWQRNYYDHIIRHEKALAAIRHYIQFNPLIWAYDRENPCAPWLPRDDVRRVLAQHYGFTDEELDFIINYDIKYRMGRDAEADEEE